MTRWRLIRRPSAPVAIGHSSNCCANRSEITSAQCNSAFSISPSMPVMMQSRTTRFYHWSEDEIRSQRSSLMLAGRGCSARDDLTLIHHSILIDDLMLMNRRLNVILIPNVHLDLRLQLQQAYAASRAFVAPFLGRPPKRPHLRRWRGVVFNTHRF